MNQTEREALHKSICDRLQDPVVRQLLIDVALWKAASGDAYTMHGLVSALIDDGPDLETFLACAEDRGWDSVVQKKAC